MTKVAFWAHQVLEYCIGLFLLSQALGRGSALPIAGAGMLVLLAATADGPLAAWKAVPRRVHRVLDLVVAVALVVASILLYSRTPLFAVVLTWLTAVLLVVLVIRTDWTPKQPRRRIIVPATSEDVGRMAGRMVGRGVRLARERKRGSSS